MTWEGEFDGLGLGDIWGDITGGISNMFKGVGDAIIGKGGLLDFGSHGFIDNMGRSFGDAGINLTKIGGETILRVSDLIGPELTFAVEAYWGVPITDYAELGIVAAQIMTPVRIPLSLLKPGMEINFMGDGVAEPRPPQIPDVPPQFLTVKPVDLIAKMYPEGAAEYSGMKRPILIKALGGAEGVKAIETSITSPYPYQIGFKMSAPGPDGNPPAGVTSVARTTKPAISFIKVPATTTYEWSLQSASPAMITPQQYLKKYGAPTVPLKAINPAYKEMYEAASGLAKSNLEMRSDFWGYNPHAAVKALKQNYVLRKKNFDEQKAAFDAEVQRMVAENLAKMKQAESFQAFSASAQQVQQAYDKGATKKKATIAAAAGLAVVAGFLLLD